MHEPDPLPAPDEELLNKIDVLLEKPDGAQEETDSMLGFCAHLASTVPQARPGFQQKLWTEMAERQTQSALNSPSSADQPGHFAAWSLSAGQAAQKGNRRFIIPRSWWRMLQGRRKSFVWLAGMALVGLMVLLVALSPVRVRAQQLLQQVMLGAYARVVQVEPDQTGPTSVIKPTLPADIWGIQTVLGLQGGMLPTGVNPRPRVYQTIAEAQTELSYPLLAPAYLPAGYSLQKVALEPKGAGETAVQFYSGPGKEIDLVTIPIGDQPCNLPAMQTPLPANVTTICQAETVAGVQTTGSLQEASVNSQKAVWVNGEGLLWSTDTLFYQLGGPDLTQAEATQIAESLK